MAERAATTAAAFGPAPAHQRTDRAGELHVVALHRRLTRTASINPQSAESRNAGGQNRGNCASDRRQLSIISTVYETPQFSNTALRSWAAAGRFRELSGSNPAAT